MAKYHQEQVEQLLERHFELEQSETKAQATLVTILSLTQITELKLLLDIGRSGHNFYDFVLTLLVASICLEIFIGIVIIYIGNLNYFHSTDRIGCHDVTSACSLPGTSSATSGYDTLKRLSTSGDCDHMTGSPPSHGITGIVCYDSPPERHVTTSIAEAEHLDASIEMAIIKMVDIEQKTNQVSGYVRVLEEALRKNPGNAELREELTRARSNLNAFGRERDETEVKRRAAEAQMDRALVVKRREEECQALETFRRICHWKQVANYALYVVMLLNIFITTFGISGGSSSSRVLVTRPRQVHNHVVGPLLLPPSQSASSAFNTTNYH